MGEFHVLICGGGVAAAEGLLRLRALAGDSVAITLLAPNREFVYRPLAVREAAGFEPARRYELAGIAEHAGAHWIKDTLAGVDVAARTAHTGQGRELSYDALLVAVGGSQIVDLERAVAFKDADAARVYDEVVRGVESGDVVSVAFVVPEGPVYPLPVYELALMTAAAARRSGVARPRLSIVTPEPITLAAFGTSAGVVVSGLLATAGIRVYASATAFAPGAHELLIQPHGVELSADRIVAMPRIAGPRRSRDSPGAAPRASSRLTASAGYRGRRGASLPRGMRPRFRSNMEASARSRRTRPQPPLPCWRARGARWRRSSRRSGGSCSPELSRST